MAADAVAGWPDSSWEIQRAKQLVEQGEVDREIDVNRFALDAVMPMMKTRSYEETAQPIEVPFQVGMNEGRMHVEKQQVRLQRTLLKAKRRHRNGCRCSQYHDLEKVHPRPGNPIH